MSRRLVIRNVTIDRRHGLDVAVEDGRIIDIAPDLPGASEEIEGRGGRLLPGLCDHHIHLMALAAKQASVDLSQARDLPGVAGRIAEAAASSPPGAWIRSLGYHERIGGELTRADLDRLAPRHRLRMQHQSGALWMLNSLALAALPQGPLPPCVECDSRGAPTGRIWRGDRWLREQIGAEPPPLAPVGRMLAAKGVTHLTDASVTTDETAADLLAEAHRRGELPQHLTLMSGGRLAAPQDAAFAVGPVKILLDDHNLPDLGHFAERIAGARDQGRRVAVHCVTAGEMALTLAAFEIAGAQSGDRIEHGGVIPAAAIPLIRAMGLTVVTQPVFVRERGDRYWAEVSERDQADLYRCASLLNAGVPVAGSSDAPYASADPWAGMAAAVERRTASGMPLGEGEQIGWSAAVDLYLGSPQMPGGRRRRVKPGAPADLCLMRPLTAADAHPDAAMVAATLIAGEIAYLAENIPI
ncbi:amidohydrolase family protein [Phenylobacterium montanum]|uniref:Amidohydrolase family protein n=1 Tax=Phenylobacterium montanum TaxID=2823693 RepID=A0A975IWS8_9CAUL|nr:amidohydrolase family protein [Caulobacter sp. S6]QUD90392.1 amidohydrolase family protein [Caulobacter sp. S6]